MNLIPYTRESSHFSLGGDSVEFNGATSNGCAICALGESRGNWKAVVRCLIDNGKPTERWIYFRDGKQFEVDDLFDMSLPPLERETLPKMTSQK